MKKIISALLCAIMVLSFTATSFAASKSVELQAFKAKKDQFGIVEVKTNIKNVSSKEIKKVAILCSVLDAEGKEIIANTAYSEKKSAWLSVKKKIKKGKRITALWQTSLANQDAKTVKVKKIKVTFKNGKSKVVKFSKKYKLKNYFS